MKPLDLLRRLLGSRFAREGAWIGFGRGSSIVARLLGLRIVTELVPPAVFSEVALIVGVQVLARTVFCGPLVEASWRFYADAIRERAVAAHRRLVGGQLVRRMPVVVLVLLLGGGAWSVWIESAATAIGFAAVALMAVTEVQKNFETSLLNAARRQTAYAVWQGLQEWLRQAGAIATVLMLGPRPGAVILGYAIGVGLTNLVMARFRVLGEDGASGEGQADWVEKRSRQVSRYTLPLVWLAVVAWIVSFSDRYVLAALTSTAEAGLYVAAYGLASQPFLLAAGIVTLTFRPIYTQAAVGREYRKERRTLLLWVALLGVVLSFGVAAFAIWSEPIAGLLLASEYRGSAGLLPWIAAAYAFRGCAQLFESVIYAQQRTRLLVFIQVAAAATGLGLYFFLIPRFGALGAALGTFGSMLVTLLAMATLSGALPRMLSVPARPGAGPGGEGAATG